MGADQLIQRVDQITDSGAVVKFDEGSDLDAVILELLQIMVTEGWYIVDNWQDDDPTAVDLGWDLPLDGAEVGWFRWNPCPRSCGEHGLHIQPLGDERPTDGRGRGAWYGMWFK